MAFTGQEQLIRLAFLTNDFIAFFFDSGKFGRGVDFDGF